MESLMDKIKARRTRKAELEDGSEIFIRVYSKGKAEEIAKGLQSADDAAVAKLLCEQFEDAEGKPALTPEFILSDDCPQVFVSELLTLFMEVNAGLYGAKKKRLELRAALGSSASPKPAGNGM